MRRLITLILTLGILFCGCQGLVQKGPIEDSQLDSYLTSRQPEAEAPATDPGQPQKELEQDVQDALTL